jgi:hypothetical protein
MTLEGKVRAYRPEAKSYKVYPYAFPDFLNILGDTSALVFGIAIEPKKTPRSKRIRPKIKKQ